MSDKIKSSFEEIASVAKYFRSFSNLLIFIAVIAVFMWLSVQLQDILAYIIISLIISSILQTPTNYISNVHAFGYRFPRALAVFISFLLLFSIIGLFVFLFYPLIKSQIAVLSEKNTQELLSVIEGPIYSLEALVKEYFLNDAEDGFLLNQLTEKISSTIQSDKLRSILNGVLAVTGNFFVGTMAVLFITFFFLYDPSLFRRQFIILIPNKYFEVSIAAIIKTEKLLSSYLLGLFLQMLSIFSIATIGLKIANVEYAITIAVFAAVANLIPYLGPFIGGSFGVLVGILTDDSLVEVSDYIFLIIKVLSVFGVVQLVDNVVVQPIIFSRSVKMHPLAIFLAVFVGSALGGVIGMVFAIPTLTILKVGSEEFWYGYKKYQIFRNEKPKVKIKEASDS
ncbi:AI-2E family transporter [Flammeovirga kamogawensis]|uniref:AI-2E family transporter n=1 Tax=Flammeovirga kamogawensis TaxID=373891 RepID=A0ABX8GWQ1_9BACT|nr:AI-2E family transporter [Flammeovirga kamogawensis]MBB6460680.1 putative PurR-regulated permease PerM [Flammeovirga kamogawensis]QWG08035.1 AI-2E family transporter [Flammeovirga kamogawensis]TRX69842.1 AI-2E family transporter [Flammeovirga kamogawensis]